MSMFSKTSTYDPMSQYSPEQRKSVEALMSLAATGTGGGITLGQKYSGDLGNYEQGEQGLAGGNILEGLMTGAYDPNSDMGKARGIYQGFADLGKFDPDDPKWGYAAFNKALAKSGAESASVLDREAAISGNRYGTAIGGQKADLAENLNLQRQSALANIFQGSQQFAALGAQGFTGLANQVANIAGLNINYDDYQRQLKDTEAKDMYNEYKRARTEELSRIGLMQAERSDPLGTITMKEPSAWGKIATAALTGVGAYLGGPAGAAVGAELGGALTGGTSVNGVSTSFGGQSSGYGGQGGFDFSNLFSGSNMGGGGTSKYGNYYGSGTPSGARDTGTYTKL